MTKTAATTATTTSTLSPFLHQNVEKMTSSSSVAGAIKL